MVNDMKRCARGQRNARTDRSKADTNSDVSAAVPLPVPDRRVLRTQRALQEALHALTLRKGYEQITVEELCGQANVGRSTFYEHFRGKNDLKRCGIQALAAEFGGSASGELSFAFSLPLLQHARMNLRHIRALGRGRGREVALKALSEIVHRQLERELLIAKHVLPEERELAAQYFTGAFMSVLIGWLDSGAHVSPEKVDAGFRSLSIGGDLVDDIRAS